MTAPRSGSRPGRRAGAGGASSIAVGGDPDLDRQARVDPAVDLADVGQRLRRRRPRRQRLLEQRPPRTGRRAARWAATAAQRGDRRRRDRRGCAGAASARAISGKRRPSAERADVRADRLDREPASAARRRERVEQLGVGVDGDDLVTGGREVIATRPVPAPSSSEPPGRSAASRAPERRGRRRSAPFSTSCQTTGSPAAGAVGSRRRAHRQNSAARPRSASSVRSSISAV